MTWEELLKGCASGKMPRVKTSSGRGGTVRAIRDEGSHRGCTVELDGMNYASWYWAVDGKDQRSRYIRDLTLVDERDIDDQISEKYEPFKKDFEMFWNEIRKEGLYHTFENWWADFMTDKIDEANKK